ncbi:MAG: hypothetical protein JST00_28730 [Deltaproteobacteria bacterium]|nr:hypothetical protein [Deltaproteobacteria bacterium]
MMALHARAACAFLVAGVVLVPASFLACSSEDSPGPSGGDAAANAEPLFRAVQSELVARCGGQNGSCHVRGPTAPNWLADPDPYLSAKKYRGILPATQEVGDSIILTQVDHVGPSLKRYPDLFRRVGEWLSAEVPQPPLPNTGNIFVADGLNSIPLDNVASGLTGARLQFLGSDGTNGTMILSALKLIAPQNANVKVDSPFFVILPRSGKVNADPEKNGFKGELTVPAGQTKDLFEGKMVLTGWDIQGQLKVVFKKIESSPGTGANQGCTALDIFKSSALPQLRAPIDIYADDDNDGGVLDASVIGKGSCVGCHAAGDEPGGGAPPAVNAFNLRAVDTDPAVACGFARTHINFKDKSQSLILLNPQGKANPNHPVKPLAVDDPVVKGIEAWVNAEKE